MKLVLKIFFGVLFLKSSFLFASYSSSLSQRDIPDFNFKAPEQDKPQSSAVSHLVLSKEGEPLCMVDVGQNPELLPSFWTARSSARPLEGGLPTCGVEDLNIIYKITQNAVLQKEGDLGVEMAGGLVLPFMCLGGVALGFSLATWTSEKPILTAGEIDPFHRYIKTGLAAGSGAGLIALGVAFEEVTKKPSSLLKGGGVVGICATVTYSLLAIGAWSDNNR